MSERSDYLYEKANKLEAQVGIMKNIAHNLFAGNSLSDKERRNFLNNERKSFPLGREFSKAIKGILFMDGAPPVISFFAIRGDPLCIKIRKYLNSTNLDEFLFLKDSGISEKLLTRRMTEEEYFGYLNGELPVSTYVGEHYLPQTEEVVDALKVS